MRKMAKSPRNLLLGIASFFMLTIHAQEYPFRNPDLPIADRVQDLLSRLTLEEKAAQMQNRRPQSNGSEFRPTTGGTSACTASAARGTRPPSSRRR